MFTLIKTKKALSFDVVLVIVVATIVEAIVEPKTINIITVSKDLLTITLDSKFETFSELRSKLKHAEVPIRSHDNFYCFHRGDLKLINDFETIASCDNNNKHSTTIYLLNSNDSLSYVRVYYLNSIEIIIVDETHTIKDLKELIEKVLFVSVEDQHLFFNNNNEELDTNDKTLIDYNLKKGSFIRLIKEFDFNVTIKGYINQKYLVKTYQLNSDHKVKDLKLKIEKDFNIPAKDQRLITQNDYLSNDDNLIQDYLINKQLNLTLADDLREGGFVNIVIEDYRLFHLNVNESNTVIEIRNAISNYVNMDVTKIKSISFRGEELLTEEKEQSTLGDNLLYGGAWLLVKVYHFNYKYI